MVGGGGASRKGEFAQGGLGRDENVVGGEARPNRIEGLEPVEEVGVLRGRDGASEGLVEVVMGVDEAGQNDVAFEVEDFVGGGGQIGNTCTWRKCRCLPYGFDDAVANKKTTLGNFPLVVVHRDEVRVFDEESGHGF